jgi:hypothetical protein
MTSSNPPMTGTDARQGQPMTSRLPLAWLTVLGGFIAFWLFAGPYVPAAFEYPKEHVVSLPGGSARR